MSERIEKTPIEEALVAMNTVWDDAQQRLDDMGPEQALAKMPGALYRNSRHPFRDKLHIEGMEAGLRFALTGKSPAVEYMMQRAADIKTGKITSPTPQTLTPLSKLQTILIVLRHGLGVKVAWDIFRSRPVRN